MIIATKMLSPLSFDRVPNTWWPVGQAKSDPAPGKLALYICGEGHEGFLDGQDIAPDGVVQFMLECMGVPDPECLGCGTGCTFKEYVRLDGWESV